MSRRALALLASLAVAFTAFSGCAAGMESAAPPPVLQAVEDPQGSEPVPLMRCLYYERELFLSAMSRPRAYRGDGRMAAGMVPHHLLASDMIAGFFRLAAENAGGYDTVLLVAPSHFPENCGSDVVTATWNWQTPYGKVETDASITGLLLNDAAIGAEDNPAAVELDHGVAGLLPFVGYYLPGTKVAACLLSNRLDRQRLSAVWERIAEICADERVLLVASVDCSHYLDPDAAALRDSQTAEAIESLDLRRILTFDDSNVDSPQALTTFLAAVQARGGEPRQLDHSSSAEKLPHAIANPIYQEGITTYFVYALFDDQAGESP